MLGGIYMEVYRFPHLIYTLRPAIIIWAVLISIASALVGTVHSLWRAPNSPCRSHAARAPCKIPGFAHRKERHRALAQPAVADYREECRAQARADYSICPRYRRCLRTMISSGFFEDAVAQMVNVQFVLSRRKI